MEAHINPNMERIETCILDENRFVILLDINGKLFWSEYYSNGCDTGRYGNIAIETDLGSLKKSVINYLKYGPV